MDTNTVAWMRFFILQDVQKRYKRMVKDPEIETGSPEHLKLTRDYACALNAYATALEADNG